MQGERCMVCNLRGVDVQDGIHVHLDDGRLCCLVCYERSLYEANIDAIKAMHEELENDRAFEEHREIQKKIA